MSQRASDCRDCGAPIWWLVGSSGKRIAVNCKPTEDRFRPPSSTETRFIYGKHQPHFTTCGKR